MAQQHAAKQEQALIDMLTGLKTKTRQEKLDDAWGALEHVVNPKEAVRKEKLKLKAQASQKEKADGEHETQMVHKI